MRTRFPAIVGMLGAALVVTVAFWAVAHFVAPYAFVHLWHGERSWLARATLAAIAPVLVAVPLGLALGALPLRRPAIAAFSIALVAACLDIAQVAWAGVDLMGPGGWTYPLEAILLIALFTGAAVCGARLFSGVRRDKRTVAGVIALCLVTAVLLGGAYWSFQQIAARAA